MRARASPRLGVFFFLVFFLKGAFYKAWHKGTVQLQGAKGQEITTVGLEVLTFHVQGDC